MVDYFVQSILGESELFFGTFNHTMFITFTSLSFGPALTSAIDVFGMVDYFVQSILGESELFFCTFNQIMFITFTSLSFESALTSAVDVLVRLIFCAIDIRGGPQVLLIVGVVDISTS